VGQKSKASGGAKALRKFCEKFLRSSSKQLTESVQPMGRFTKSSDS
jgi:hypothetical protein